MARHTRDTSMTGLFLHVLYLHIIVHYFDGEMSQGHLASLTLTNLNPPMMSVLEGFHCISFQARLP